MISLGELLALLATSDERWQHLHMHYVLRERLPGSGPSRPEFPGPGADARTLGPEVTFDVHAAARPFRLHLARIPAAAASPVDAPDFALDDGTQVWLQTGIEVHHVPFRIPTDPWLAEVSRLLLPRAVSARSRLRVLGEGTVAGRACWQVEARAVQDPPLAQEIDSDLLVDQQTGVILQQHRYWHGEQMDSAVATLVEVDGPPVPGLFTFTAPAGARVYDGLPVLVPTRYQPALVVGLLLAGATDLAARVVTILRRRPPRRLY